MYYHNMMLQYEVLLFDVNVIVEEVMPKKVKMGVSYFPPQETFRRARERRTGKTSFTLQHENLLLPKPSLRVLISSRRLHHLACTETEHRIAQFTLRTITFHHPVPVFLFCTETTMFSLSLIFFMHAKTGSLCMI